jgi:hypothetical protein
MTLASSESSRTVEGARADTSSQVRWDCVCGATVIDFGATATLFLRAERHDDPEPT